MSADMPESIDVWRAVGARRIFEGELPLSRFARLRECLVDADGSCRYRLEFDRDGFGGATVLLTAEAGLALQCQRSLERFVFPVRCEQRLGLIRNEQEEAALAPETEPVLVPENGMLHPLDLVEDELILALPVVPLSPDSPLPPAAVDDGDVADAARPNPFAALAALKPKP